jgi:hypothetical protein
MNKKIIISLLLISSVFIFSGCGEKDKKVEKVTNSEEVKDAPKESAETKNVSSGSCQEEKVSLPNYGDPGKRLKNCFVQYPGEPSRQDKSYYVVEDICGQFTQSFMESMLGQKLLRIEPSKISTLYNCTYYLDDKEYVMLVLDYLKAENQKIGQEAMGRKVEKKSDIPMDNWVVTQEDGEINNIYFILGPEKFLSLQRSSKAALTNDKILDFSKKLGAAIKEYK